MKRWSKLCCYIMNCKQRLRIFLGAAIVQVGLVLLEFSESCAAETVMEGWSSSAPGQPQVI